VLRDRVLLGLALAWGCTVGMGVFGA
jgi:hypothetical protein